MIWAKKLDQVEGISRYAGKVVGLLASRGREQMRTETLPPVSR